MKILLSLPGKGLTSIFTGPPSPPALPEPPPLPSRDDPAIAARQKELAAAEARRMGRGKTILTSGLGDPGVAPVTRAAASPVLSAYLGGGS